MNDHLSRPVVANRLKRPFPGRGGQPQICPLFGLAPDGVYIAIPVAWMLVSSYLTFPPSHAGSWVFNLQPPGCCISLLHFPWSRLHWVLPSTLPCGARTFLVCPKATAIICLTHFFIHLFRNYIITCVFSLRQLGMDSLSNNILPQFSHSTIRLPSFTLCTTREARLIKQPSH